LNAAVSKTVRRRLGVSRVRIPPPPLGLELLLVPSADNPARIPGQWRRWRVATLGLVGESRATAQLLAIAHRSHRASVRLPIRRDQSYTCRDASIAPPAPRRGDRRSPLAPVCNSRGQAVRLSPRLPGPGLLAARWKDDPKDVSLPRGCSRLARRLALGAAARNAQGADPHQAFRGGRRVASGRAGGCHPHPLR
jgi:hypothetical protein